MDQLESYRASLQDRIVKAARLLVDVVPQLDALLQLLRPPPDWPSRTCSFPWPHFAERVRAVHLLVGPGTAAEAGDLLYAEHGGAVSVRSPGPLADGLVAYVDGDTIEAVISLRGATIGTSGDLSTLWLPGRVPESVGTGLFSERISRVAEHPLLMDPTYRIERVRYSDRSRSTGFMFRTPRIAWRCPWPHLWTPAAPAI